MKLIVTGSYEESSRIAADMFEEVIINKKNPLLGCATGSTPIGLYQCLTEDYRAGKNRLFRRSYHQSRRIRRSYKGP